jgi:hypothetical protein
MSEFTTLGSWLRRERERRGVTLAKISEETKVGLALLQGLEADDLSRWPGGIFRRAFTRSYATAIGLDPELVVRRVEEEHPSDQDEPAAVSIDAPPSRSDSARTVHVPAAVQLAATPPAGRLQPAALDLLVAGAIGFGFAAAGSRLLWPVIVIAAYHAVGLLLTGTSPMMALFAQARPSAPEPQPTTTASTTAAPEVASSRRPEVEPRHVRRARARRSKDHAKIKGSKDHARIAQRSQD